MSKIKNRSDCSDWRASNIYYITIAIVDIHTPIDKKVVHILVLSEVFSNEDERNQYVKKMNISNRNIKSPVFYFIDPTYIEIKKMFPNCTIKYSQKSNLQNITR
jgi:hypothetical protein